MNGARYLAQRRRRHLEGRYDHRAELERVRRWLARKHIVTTKLYVTAGQVETRKVMEQTSL